MSQTFVILEDKMSQADKASRRHRPFANKHGHKKGRTLVRPGKTGNGLRELHLEAGNTQDDYLA